MKKKPPESIGDMFKCYMEEEEAMEKARHAPAPVPAIEDIEPIADAMLSQEVEQIVDSDDTTVIRDMLADISKVLIIALEKHKNVDFTNIKINVKRTQQGPDQAAVDINFNFTR